MKFNQKIRVQNEVISQDSSTFIIAEAGVNHNGSMESAKRLIDVAAKASADYVKFQTFKAETLVTQTADKAEYQKGLTGEDETQFEMIKKLETYDIVLLSRYIDGGADQRSLMRILSSKMINFFCRLILGSGIKDYTSSIFLMRKEVLKYGVPIAYGHGEFFIEFLYKVKKNGMKICELPYIQPPDTEGSKTASSILRFFTLGFGYLARILIARFRKN